MIKLICVTANNNNKYYYMEDLHNGNFKVSYGRVGGSETVLTYPISLWDKKYKDLISFLMSEAKQSIKRDYQISAESVTQEQLNEVQNIIDLLSSKIKDEKMISKDIINNYLKEIYSIIPRKMTDTRNFFLNSVNIPFLTELLQSEQSRLDTLKSQVNINQVASNGITLEELGFTCELASEEDKDMIRKNTDFKLTNHRVFKISNKETEATFNPNHLETKLLYHGSRNENFLSILQTGLKIRPKGVQTTGSMFGDGIYAANKARKSIGYTSLRGSYWASGHSNRAYLAIFEFATGKEWNLLDNQSWSGWMSRIDESQVKSKGCDSVFAKGGVDLRNDEYVVYNSNQCTIRYLIELKED